VYDVSDFTISIYRVAEPKESFRPQQPGGTRYIALIPEYFPTPSQWHTDDTLFGLQKKMKAITVVDWENAERDLAANGSYILAMTKDGI